MDDVVELVWLAYQGSLEFHLRGSRPPRLAQPNHAIFDLNPGHEAAFGEVLQTVLLPREVPAHLALEGCAKTSGGRGLHIYVPVAPEYTFDKVCTWVRALVKVRG